MSDWRPITEPPTESGVYLVFAKSADPDKPMRQLAWYEPPGTENMEGWQLLPRVWLDALTHWMPLPEPPANGHAGEPAT